MRIHFLFTSLFPNNNKTHELLVKLIHSTYLQNTIYQEIEVQYFKS